MLTTVREHALAAVSLGTLLRIICLLYVCDLSVMNVKDSFIQEREVWGQMTHILCCSLQL